MTNPDKAFVDDMKAMAGQIARMKLLRFLEKEGAKAQDLAAMNALISKLLDEEAAKAESAD